MRLINPESVACSMEEHGFASYWGQTSTYEAIGERIRMNFAGTKEDVIRMLSGEGVEVNITRFMNTMDSFKTKSDVFTYLIHLGYLTYDKETGTCRIPNGEVRQEWLNAIEAEPGYEALRHYQGDLLLVGIEYDEQTKEHKCKIEKFSK